MTRVLHLNNRAAARAILNLASKDAVKAGTGSGRTPSPVNGMWLGLELDICRRQMVETRRPPGELQSPLSLSPVRIVRTFKTWR